MGKAIFRTIDEHSKVLVLHYNALDAKEWTDFRYEMKQEKIDVKVFPNKLTCKFLSETKYRNMNPLFRTDTAIAFGSEFDLKRVLKVLNANTNIELIGGKLDDALYNRQQIIEFSNLPTLEEARGELLQILQQPAQTLSRSLQSNQSQLSLLLQSHVEKNETTQESE